MLTALLESGLPSDKGIRPQLTSYLTCLSDVTPTLTSDGNLEQAQILNVGRTHRHANRQQRRTRLPTPPQVGRSPTAGQRRSRD
jgi:hypothetical protein